MLIKYVNHKASTPQLSMRKAEDKQQYGKINISVNCSSTKKAMSLDKRL